MAYRPTVLERAFIIAASGLVSNIHEIRQALKTEGYSAEAHLAGPAISKQLGKLIRASNSSTEARRERQLPEADAGGPC
ncbi:MAG: hypothetical protein JWN34_1306 [Bryobacterales bacterium]|nr:hypothetical protein [Bryobacterales bacterium]